MADFRWLKIDTASIMFSSLSSKEWGRTFRYSAFFTKDIDPVALEKAAKDLMPYFPATYAYLKKGFFWNYLALSERQPEIREENESGMLPITKRKDGRPDFRLTYKGNRLNIESSHSLGDGKGIMEYFKALLKRYNEICNGETGKYTVDTDPVKNITNAFSDYYDENGEKAQGDNPKAFHFEEEYEDNYLRLLFAEMSSEKVKERAHKENLTVTEYLTAVLMLGIIRSRKEPIRERVTVAVPVNLRSFFDTESVRNFTIQSFISFSPEGRDDISLKEIIEATRGQLKAQLKKEELQKTINKYGGLVNNPVLRIVPNTIKLPVLRKMQQSSHAGVYTILTNYGVCELNESLQGVIEKLQFVNGDTRKYGLAVTCSCISFNDTLSLCFSRANRDTVFQNECIKILNEVGIETEISVIEGKGEDKKYPDEGFKEGFSAEKIKAYFNI
ncbi:MAG: hypothetical protein IKL10_06035 [Clostridia bacterium]|nr:hypothetical protein [Clostridia bacterium]